MTAARLALAGMLAAATAAGEQAAPERLRGVDAAALAHTYAVGSFVPEYEPPPPGSYELPVIDSVGDHPLVDADGRATSLFAMKGERLAVVAFVYTTCVEAVGCPLSNAVLQRVDRALADDATLRSRVTLITVSFDPERDPPERMAAMRTLHAPRADWRFATTRGDEVLRPLLEDFDQPVARLRFDDGTWTGLYRHVLKVFLLDGRNRVRNVYSTGFLNPALLLNDLRTIVRETPRETR